MKSETTTVLGLESGWRIRFTAREIDTLRAAHRILNGADNMVQEAFGVDARYEGEMSDLMDAAGHLGEVLELIGDDRCWTVSDVPARNQEGTS